MFFFTVILGPYGLCGLLTGTTFKSSDSSYQKLLEEWKQFFPVDSRMPNTGRDADPTFPVLVEVVVGGHKMKYPSSYVMVSDMDEYSPLNRVPAYIGAGSGSGEMKDNMLGSATSSLNANNGEEFCQNSHNSPFTASTHTLLTPAYLGSGGKGLGWSRGLGERVWQDFVQCPGHQSQQSNEGLGPEGVMTPIEMAGQWDFADPSTKMNCSCTK